MRKVLIFGGPGTDRISPGGILAASANIGFISAGDLFREHVARQTPLGERISRHLSMGELVPDELSAEAVAGALAESDSGWVLCGYPNTVQQAECLARRGHQPDAVIELVLANHERRLVTRRAAEPGHDVQLIQSLYEEQAGPLRSYYQDRGTLYTASGLGDYQEVAARLIATLSRYPDPHREVPGPTGVRSKPCQMPQANAVNHEHHRPGIPMPEPIPLTSNDCHRR